MSEMQHLREREIIVDMMLNMDMDQEEAMSSEDRLFAAPVQQVSRPASCPAPTHHHHHQIPASPAVAAPHFSVVGGRLIQQPSGGGYPLNGQQLQLQLDQLTSALTDMAMEDDTMEAPLNPAYAQYIQERAAAESAGNPFSQEEKRRDPVYLTSMAAHSVPSPPPSPNNSSAEQKHLTHEQQLLLILQEQQQQLQLQQLAYEHQQQMYLDNTPASSPPQPCCLPPPDGDFQFHSRRAFSRQDLLPIQKCGQWS